MVIAGEWLYTQQKPRITMIQSKWVCSACKRSFGRKLIAQIQKEHLIMEKYPRAFLSPQLTAQCLEEDREKISRLETKLI